MICLLRRPPDAPELPETELEQLQERHVAYQAWLREQGKISTAGPFSDQPDESWLHILQNKETIAGLRFLGSRARRQNRALEIDRNFLVRLFGPSKIKSAAE